MEFEEEEEEEPTDQVGEQTEQANSDSWPQRCLKRIVLNLTFSFSMFAGSSLFLSGFFTEYMSPDEDASDDSQYGSILALSFGLLVLLYSVVGLCSSCCLRIFCEKYILICSVNAILGFTSLSFVAFGKPSHEAKTMDVTMEEAA